MPKLNLTGQIFGELEVVSIDQDSIGSSKIKWYCKCHKCNKYDLVSIRGGDLITGRSQSCGCGKNISKGSQKILDILLNNFSNNIICEYNFPDLINPKTNKYLKFDFYIPDKNILIEYDGEQHFYYTNGEKTWNNKQHFEECKYRDNLKNIYCIKHNIALYRIPYFDIDKINNIEDILQDQYLINNK